MYDVGTMELYSVYLLITIHAAPDIYLINCIIYLPVFVGLAQIFTIFSVKINNIKPCWETLRPAVRFPLIVLFRFTPKNK